MGNHIHNTAAGLKRAQGIGEFRIHQTENRTEKIRSVSVLGLSVLVGENSGVAPLASCCRNGEDNTDRQGLFRIGFTGVEIPDIPWIGNAYGNGFGRVDYAAPSDSKNTGNTLTAAEVNTITDHGKSRIRLHTTELNTGNTGISQIFLHPVVKSGLLYTAPTIVKQDFIAQFQGFGNKRFFGITADNELSGADESEIEHKNLLGITDDI
jgi:hypothetical protein